MGAPGMAPPFKDHSFISWICYQRWSGFSYGGAEGFLALGDSLELGDTSIGLDQTERIFRF